MRFIKLGLISIVGLFSIIWLISLLIPSHVRVSRAINIEAPRDSILYYLSDLRQWKTWNLLMASEGITNPAYSEKTFTSDALQVKLVAVQPDTVTTAWRQGAGKETISAFALHTVGNTSVVQWYFDFRLSWYPWEKFGSIIFDKQLGPPMEQSLGELKKKLETSAR